MGKKCDFIRKLLAHANTAKRSKKSNVSMNHRFNISSLVATYESHRKIRYEVQEQAMSGCMATRNSLSAVFLLRSPLRSTRLLLLCQSRATLRSFPWIHVCRPFSAEQVPRTRTLNALTRQEVPEQTDLEVSTMSSHQSTLDANSMAPDAAEQIVAIVKLPLETGRESIAEEDDFSDDDDDPSGYKNLSRPLLDFIITRVSDFNKGAHADRMTFSDFKAFWRTNFEKIRLEVTHSHESDLFITDPPLKELEIEILNTADYKFCPCRFDYVDAHITIRAEQGITRDVFLEGLRDQLYGEAVRSEHLRLSDRHRGMLVPTDWNYMEEDEGVFYPGSQYDRMRIWVYCSDQAIPHEQRENKL